MWIKELVKLTVPLILIDILFVHIAANSTEPTILNNVNTTELTSTNVTTTNLTKYFYAVKVKTKKTTIKKKPTRKKINVKKGRGSFDFRDVINININFPAVENKCNLRIVGGVKCERGDVPYQVNLRQGLQGGTVWHSFCGGAIVTTLHVLTAAHCFATARPRSVRVIAGTTTSSIRFPKNKAQRGAALKALQKVETWRTIKECHQHSGYHRSAYYNDFAVIVLNKAFVFSETLNAIRMLSPKNKKPTGLCLVSGFGKIENNKLSKNLQMVCLPAVHDIRCKRIFKTYRGGSTQICAGAINKDSCQGDSGGPMVCNGLLTGIVSYGSPTCGRYPAAYTLISGYTTGKKISFKRCRAVQHNFNIIKVVIALTLTYIYYTTALFYAK